MRRHAVAAAAPDACMRVLQHCSRLPPLAAGEAGCQQPRSMHLLMSWRHVPPCPGTLAAACMHACMCMQQARQAYRCSQPAQLTAGGAGCLTSMRLSMGWRHVPPCHSSCCCCCMHARAAALQPVAAARSRRSRLPAATQHALADELAACAAMPWHAGSSMHACMHACACSKQGRHTAAHSRLSSQPAEPAV